MKLAIMQPYFFPYIGYFQLINAVDKFIIYDDVNYIKQGWINRNSILIQNKPNLFTLPLNNSSSFLKINEVLVDAKRYSYWLEKFLKTLELSYKKAPMFEAAYNLIKHILSLEINSSNIALLNYQSIKAICSYLEIKTALVPSSSIYQNAHLKAQERILDICTTEKAKTYINPSGGIELYNKEEFKDQDIDLWFLKSSPIAYRQFTDEFCPWLSIIDVIMFNSPEDTKLLLKKYELV